MRRRQRSRATVSIRRFGSGAKVTRFDYTGQFVGNGVTDIAIYFTVIDYVALPNASLTGANFTAYDGSDALVTLPRTGQTTSYVSGDDGSQLKGAAWPAVRFIDNQDGTVTDHVTGLIWLKDAGCLPPALWTAAIAEVNQLANGACGLSDGSTAGKWRMPNLNELESLIDVSANHADFFNQTYTWKIGQALYQPPIFSNFMVSEYYWTSTTNAADPTEAWTVYSCDSACTTPPRRTLDTRSR